MIVIMQGSKSVVINSAGKVLKTLKTTELDNIEENVIIDSEESKLTSTVNL